MKKISGWFYCRPLGEYNYEFFVEDNATDEEIKEKIFDTLEISYDYNVDEGYEAVVETVYRKKDTEIYNGLGANWI